MHQVYKFTAAVSFLFVAVCSNAFAQLSGAYSINAAFRTNGTNFQTFAEFAVAVWSNGVSGPVTATVEPGSGPYTEQVAFNPVPGASPTNRITVEGNGAILQYSTSSSFPDAYTLKIASSYVTINNLNVKSLHATVGYGIYVTNNAKQVTLTNNTVEVTKTNDVSSAFGILVAGPTSYLLSGSLSDSLRIEGNTVIGGYSCIQLSGEGFTSGSTDPTEKIRDAYVAGNVLKDFYATGLWLSYTHNAVVTGNQISRPTRTNSGTDSQTPAGITITSGSVGFVVEKNRVFGFAEGGQGAFDAIARGIYLSGTATALTSGTIRNNLIYGLRNNHSAYGMHINSWSNQPLYIYHNTIAIDQDAGTTVSGAFPSSGYQTAAINFGGTSPQNNIHVMHNVFYVRRDGNVGKRIYYISNAASNITSDYNVFYVDGLGTGLTDFAHRTTSTQYIDLAAWQATGQDAHSVLANPAFADPGTGNFVPTNNAVSGEMLGTASLGVPDDILGNARGAEPDPGAFEMEPCGLLPEANFSLSQNGNEFTFTNSSSNADSVSWDFGVAGGTSTDENPLFTYPTPGAYTVTLVVTNECGTDTFTQNISISNVNGLVETFDVTLSPNPSRGFPTLLFNQAVNAHAIDITDATGRLMRTIELKNAQQEIVLDTNGLVDGAYFVNVRSNEASIALPLVLVP
ncbi:MAG TPA: PKD domain-containing protein [Chitinophagales bacterium]|nr:PKD domain-containing protein [Chitinophagales bacterium]